MVDENKKDCDTFAPNNCCNYLNVPIDAGAMSNKAMSNKCNKDKSDYYPSMTDISLPRRSINEVFLISLSQEGKLHNIRSVNA